MTTNFISQAVQMVSNNINEIPLAKQVSDKQNFVYLGPRDHQKLQEPQDQSRNVTGQSYEIVREYECTMMLEILKDEEALKYLEKTTIENDVAYLIRKIMQDRLGNFYNEGLIRIKVNIMDHLKDINRYVYPYVITLDATIEQAMDPQHPHINKPFFEQNPDKQNIWKKFPEEIHYRSNHPLNYQFYVHIHPKNTINRNNDYYILSLIGAGAFGEVYLVRSTKEPKVYALKRVYFGNKVSMGQEMDQKVVQTQLDIIKKYIESGKLSDLDDTNISGDHNNPLRELKTLILTQTCDKPKKFLKLHKIYLAQEVDNSPDQQVKGQTRFVLYMLMDYFGGVQFQTENSNGATTVFEYFQTLKDHVDIGFEEKTVNRITGKLFLDLLDRAEEIHKLGIGLRDLHDDNVLIVRKRNNKFKLRLIDFGLSAKLAQTAQSLKYYGNNNLSNTFRDPAIINDNYKKQKYEAYFDFYGLGTFLDRIVKLYMQGQQADFTFIQADRILIAYLQRDKTNIATQDPTYPKTITQLKKTPLFIQWKQARMLQ